MITCHPSPMVFRPSVRCMSTLLNNFSSETPGPIFFRLHVEPSVKEGLKICLNGQGLLIKMGAMPIYDKKKNKQKKKKQKKKKKHLQIFYSRTKKALGLNLGI